MAVEAGAARDADYAYQAYQVLRWSFALAPILAGLDKFFHLLKDWQMYLAPAIGNLVGQAGVRAGIFMQVVGAVEIVAGFLVLLKPRVGAYVVAGWLAGIIVNLLLLSGFYDIALRDFGLCLGAIALGRLSHKFGH
ncbi:MAG TPA: hypothetical protein VN578_07350 [Candidatus Binatia bacterium]|nr:hypothetical protein [Candidatus Binatia bacterium]